MEENVMHGKAWWNATGGKTVQERNPAGRGQAAQRVLKTAGAILGAVLLVGAMVAPLYAQSYPNQPIRYVVPWPPGGATDFLARIIAPKLAERLGQPVVIENRAGAAGNVGIEFVAKARPDGYTIVMGGVDMAAAPSLYKKLNYDPIKDFAPIWRMAQAPFVLLVKPSLPVKNLKEFVQYAKANPGKVNYGSAGIGGLTHLAAEMLKNLAKIDMVHVPFRGIGPAVIGLIGGEVDMLVLAPTAAAPQIRAGKVTGLAVLGNERVATMPDVPTAKEAGIDNFEAHAWWGILAPAGTPRDIVNRLNAELVKVAAMPDTIEQIQKAGVEPVSGHTPEQFSEFIKANVVHWTKVIKDANIPSLD